MLTVSIWIMCEMLDNVCDINRGVYFLGDLNIDKKPNQRKAPDLRLGALLFTHSKFLGVKLTLIV